MNALLTCTGEQQDVMAREVMGEADQRGDLWTIRRDQHGYAVAIQRWDWDVLHLVAGTTRNESMVEDVVRRLNDGVARPGSDTIATLFNAAVRGDAVRWQDGAYWMFDARGEGIASGRNMAEFLEQLGRVADRT